VFTNKSKLTESSQEKNNEITQNNVFSTHTLPYVTKCHGSEMNEKHLESTNLPKNGAAVTW